MKKTFKIISIFIILTIIFCLNTISKAEDIEKPNTTKNLFSTTKADLPVENGVLALIAFRNIPHSQREHFKKENAP